MPVSLSVERRDMMLVPYAVLSSVYFFTFNPFFTLPPEKVSAAVLKAAPIWYLAAYLGTTPKFHDNPLALGVRAGLALSSLGDLCLIWRTHLFLLGMLFFALAQASYIYGIKSWLRRGNYPGGKYVKPTAVMGFASYVYIFTGIESWLMAFFVMVYSLLLFTMANMALQRHLVEANKGSFYGAVGGAFFVLSDTLIGICKWKFDFGMSEGLIMLTYYFAQGAIAYGAVNSARAKRRE